MKKILFCTLLALGLPGHAQFNLGKILDAGKKVVDAANQKKEFTQEDEIGLGNALTASFLGASPLHPDANLQRYVNRVGRWLALHSDRPDLPWTFSVIDTETINAFAMPGGSIIVSSGLIRQLGSEAELAGVLAHEIAHVVKKHQLAAIQANMSADAWKSVGTSIAADNVMLCLSALGSVLMDLGYPIKVGEAEAAAHQAYATLHAADAQRARKKVAAA